MVVDNFHVIGVALAELETNPPRAVDGHRPLPFAITPKLVKPDALQWAELVERFGDVQGEQQIDGCFDVQATEPAWPISLPDLAARGIPP